MPTIEDKLESLLDNILDDLVDDRERFYGPDGKLWEPIGTATDRRGAHWTLQRLDEARAISRNLLDENPYAANAIENRINYIVGTGQVWDVQPVDLSDASDAAANRVRDFIDKWKRKNHWPDRQVEHQRRTDRDGELFIRFFPQDDGLTLIRVVEPETIRPPQDRQDVNQWGIEHEPDDAETPVAYWIDGQQVPAWKIQHRKPGVDRNIPRGIPLLYPVRKNLRRAALLLRNMTALAEVQSSIALIRKHKNGTPDGIQRFADDAATKKVTDPHTGKTERFQRYGPGTILDTPDGFEYDFPGATVNAAALIEILRAELRAIAARLVMPEYMLTSDSSNGGYASTLISETPGERMMERAQDGVASDDLELLDTILDFAETAKALDPGDRKLVKITTSKPDVHIRDFAKTNIVRARAFAAGILSPQTWAKQMGYNYDREQQLIDKHYAENPNAPVSPTAERDLVRSNHLPPTPTRAETSSNKPPIQRATSDQ